MKTIITICAMLLCFSGIGQIQSRESLENSTLQEAERKALIRQIQNSNQDDWAEYKGLRTISDDVLLKFKNRNVHNSEPQENFANPENIACPNSLTTTFANNNSQNGNFFDVYSATDITIDDILINYLNRGSDDDLRIYTRSGSMVGHTGSLAGWTLRGSVVLTATASGLSIGGFNIALAAGDTTGFAIMIDSDDVGSLNYTNGTNVGDIAASNTDLTIFEGYGSAGFGLTTFSPRIWNGTICYTQTNLTPCATTTSFKLYGLNNLWKNAGANDPSIFYAGITQWKRLRANATGGVGPYTYNWSNSQGYTLKNQSADGRTIWMFEPQGPSWNIVEITDVGAGCTIKDSIFVDYSDQYHCGTPTNFWQLEMCVNGTTVCMPWGQAKTALKNNTATLGACPPPVVTKTSIENANGFIVYPNPSSNYVNVQFDATERTNVSVKIVDVNGRTLFNKKLKGESTTQLDLSNFPNGMYFVQLVSDQGVQTEKIQLMK